MNEDKNNTQANEKDETMTAEVIIDEDFISVPRTRYRFSERAGRQPSELRA